MGKQIAYFPAPFFFFHWMTMEQYIKLPNLGLTRVS